MNSIQLEPIGVVRSPYVSKYEAPRQPTADDRDDEAVIELFPHRNFEQALDDLDGFERIWVIALFDQAANWKPKILTPRDRMKRGLFATRSPHRPNPIALSVVKLLSVKGLAIHVQGLDLLSGTPVLDIKPYLPYADAFPDSRTGWLEDISPRFFSIVIPDTILESIEDVLFKHVKRTLAVDPFPHPYRRITCIADHTYELAYRQWRITYEVDDDTVFVLSIVLHS